MLSDHKSHTDGPIGKHTKNKRVYKNNIKLNNFNSYSSMKNFYLKKIMSNKDNEFYWLSLSILERTKLQYQASRYYLLSGLEKCPKSEILWKNFILSSDNDHKSRIITIATSILPKSTILWELAISLQNTSLKQKNILKHALLKLPQNSSFWKKLIELESFTMTKKLLYRAIECCPFDFELWRVLIQIENYENSKKLINIARTFNWSNFEIWLTAAQLEEIQGNYTNINKILKRYFYILNANKFNYDISEIIRFTRSLESKSVSFKITLRVLVNLLISQDLSSSQVIKNWIIKASESMSKGNYNISEEIFRNLCFYFEKNYYLWLKYLYFLKFTHQTKKFVRNIDKISTIWVNHDVTFVIINKYKSYILRNLNKCSKRLVHLTFNTRKSINIYIYSSKFFYLIKDINNYFMNEKFFSIYKNFVGFLKISLLKLYIYSNIKIKSELLHLLEKTIINNNTLKRAFITLLQSFYSCNNKYLIKNTKILMSLNFSHLIYNLEFFNCIILFGSHYYLIIASLKRRYQSLEFLWLYYLAIFKNKFNKCFMLSHLITKALKKCPSSTLLWMEFLSHRKNFFEKVTLFLAMKYARSPVYIVKLVAKQFYSFNNFYKFRLWSVRALKFNDKSFDIIADTLLYERKLKNYTNVNFFYNLTQQLQKKSNYISDFAYINQYLSCFSIKLFFKVIVSINN
uniref:Pre-mRNA splicing factor PRP 6 homolog n=1 Tax=Bigelowiella natans TaxID=227086 RepID=Q40940_BIGNA|nr:pre-mRNA splicing factor PRP 6 homolog [Bigelowiella natans]